MCFAGVESCGGHFHLYGNCGSQSPEDFLRYVNELGSGVLRNHYIIKVLYVFVFFFVVVGVGPNVAISSETWKAAKE